MDKAVTSRQTKLVGDLPNKLVMLSAKERKAYNCSKSFLPDVLLLLFGENLQRYDSTSGCDFDDPRAWHR